MQQMYLWKNEKKLSLLMFRSLFEYFLVIFTVNIIFMMKFLGRLKRKINLHFSEKRSDIKGLVPGLILNVSLNQMRQEASFGLRK